MDPDFDNDELVIELREPAVAAARVLALATALRRLALEDATVSAAEAQTEAFDLREWLREEGLLGAATPAETSLIERPIGGITAEERADLAWQGEGLAALAWALSPGARAVPGVRAEIPELLGALPAPWDRTAPWLAQARLRPEPDIALERERADVWYWRATVEALKRAASASERREYEDAIRDVFHESVTAGLVDGAPSGDFLVAGRPIHTLATDELGALIAACAERLRALNWLCGFGESWDDAPLDV